MMMMMMMMMMNAVLCLVGKNRIQRMFFFARISVFAQEVTMFAGKITVFFPGKNDHVLLVQIGQFSDCCSFCSKHP